MGDVQGGPLNQVKSRGVFLGGVQAAAKGKGWVTAGTDYLHERSKVSLLPSDEDSSAVGEAESSDEDRFAVNGMANDSDDEDFNRLSMPSSFKLPATKPSNIFGSKTNTSSSSTLVSTTETSTLPTAKRHVSAVEDSSILSAPAKKPAPFSSKGLKASDFFSKPVKPYEVEAKKETRTPTEIALEAAQKAALKRAASKPPAPRTPFSARFPDVVNKPFPSAEQKPLPPSETKSPPKQEEEKVKLAP